MDSALLIRMLDEFLVETGSQSLLDADKVRDFLLDLRSVVTFVIPEIVPEVEEACSDC